MKLQALQEGECYKKVYGDNDSIFFHVVQQSECNEDDVIYHSMEEVVNILRSSSTDHGQLHIHVFYDRLKNKKKIKNKKK